jgi:hypothetical protein
VPGESKTILNSVAEVLMSSMSVGVTHIVQDSDSELGTITSSMCSLEAQRLGLSSAVGCRNFVPVLGVWLQTSDLYLVEMLTALSDRSKGARRGTCIGVGLSDSNVLEVVLLSTPLDLRCGSKTEWSLEVNVHAAGDIGQGDDIDVVGRVGGLGLHSRSLDQAREAFTITIDGRINPVTDGNGRSSVREASVDIATRSRWCCGNEGSAKEYGSNGVLHAAGYKANGDIQFTILNGLPSYIYS